VTRAERRLYHLIRDGQEHGAAMDLYEIFIRVGMATGAGILLGLDRELRGISAGIRTHALVAMSSALITVSALILYEELRTQHGATIDPLRVVQGLAQAVGFVAAGAIFVSKSSVHNLTSAANIWLAAAVGIAAGAGQEEVVLVGLGFGVVIVTLVRMLERFIPGSDKTDRD
jgi:putative Mg2+ transporter-C (MgtC) family protein